LTKSPNPNEAPRSERILKEMSLRKAAAVTVNENVRVATDLVAGVVDQLRPENLDRESVTISAEGEHVGIVLLPHRDLGGFALILWIDPKHVQLAWGPVADLERHDDIDLAKRVAQIDRAQDSWQTETADHLAKEFRRAIRVSARRTRLRRRWLLTCSIEIGGRWRDFPITELPLFSERDESAIGTETTLAGPGRPTVRRRVPLAVWHQLAEPAWPDHAQLLDPVLVDNRGDLLVFEDLSSAVRSVEPIDVENDEYEFFDASGRIIHVGVRQGRVVVDENLGTSQPDRLAAILRAFLRRLDEDRYGLSVADLDDVTLPELVAARQRAERGTYREPGRRGWAKWFLPWLFRGEKRRWTPRP
jgi:hypothetical protein